MTPRERYFALLAGQPLDQAPFFPDITTWYERHRTPNDQPQAYHAGQFIPDDAPIHASPGTLPERFANHTFLDIYREFGWGLPIHLYDWSTTEYCTCSLEKTERNGKRTLTFHTPAGNLQKVYQLADDGSWAPLELPVKTLADLEILKRLAEDQRVVPRPEAYRAFREATDPVGVCDVVISRSPFGKLVHEFLGFQETVFALLDDKERILDFLAVQEQADLKVVETIADYPAEVVILSDHADQTLISPPYYEQYCLPFYQKACDILHRAGKKVSTHLDGNFKGFFPLLERTGFDLLDGCTPAPMFNYEPEELAELCRQTGLNAYCGVPSALFVDGTPSQGIVDFGRRILAAFDGRVLLNVGDILPPHTDIQPVIELGQIAAQTGPIGPLNPST